MQMGLLGAVSVEREIKFSTKRKVEEFGQCWKSKGGVGSAESL